jgi:mono/diheme cytochrome c family protein
MVRTIISVMRVLVILLTVSMFAGQGGNGWTIPQAGREEQSPLKPTPDVLKKGKAIFTSRCQKCHGADGKGNGPESDPDGPAADLTDDARSTVNPDGVLFYKIWNGRKSPKMPAFKTDLSKDDAWAVVEYIKTLRKSA